MAFLNQSNFIGNVGNENQIRFRAAVQTKNGVKDVLNFTIGVNNPFTGNTQWVKVSVWGERAEKLHKIIKQGMQVFITGQVDATPWVDDNGLAHADLNLYCLDVQIMGSREQNEARIEQKRAVGVYTAPEKPAVQTNQTVKTDDAVVTPPKRKSKKEAPLPDGDIPF